MNAWKLSRRLPLALLSASLALPLNGVAGEAPRAAPEPAATAAPEPAKPAESVVELSPFEVRAEGDVGYQAANTTSGSRMNSRLKDTPASVSPFTPEFLSDIAATNLEEMLGYATNIEVDTEDATAGFNNPEGRTAISNDYQFRMRGIAAGASRDYVDTSIPTDLYNVERAEVTSGPNSILFGLGQAGGSVALTGKRANTGATKTTLRNVYGSWKYERLEADHNLVLIPRRLAARVLGVYQNSEGWRHWNFNDQKRLAGAVAYKPFKTTTVHATFESGKIASSILVNWNAVDSVTRWLDAGRPVADGAAITGTTRLNQTNQRYTFLEQDGIINNMRGELQSSSTFGSQTLATPALSPYAYNNTGPGGVRTQDFDSQAVLVEQRLPKGVVLEFGYFHNRNDVVADGNSGQPTLYGDANLTIPPVSFVGTVPNAHQGQLYMEDIWSRDNIVTENDVYRLSAAWEKNLGRWFGRHRLAGLIEHSRNARVRYWDNEILVDQNNVAIANAANPEGAPNSLYRRRYVTEGDFTTYYPGNSSIAAPSFALGDRQFHPAFAARTKSNAKTRKEIDSFMVGAQSFWFGDRVVTTAGFRLDRIEFQNAREGRVSNPTDPRVLSKQVILNEWDFDGTYLTSNYEPTTFTAGAVWHAARRLSLFYNYSNNNGTPRFDRTVLPNGDLPEPTEGRGTDYGVMIDFFGDDRFFLRATRFETAQIKDAPIVPNGVGTNTSGALGGDNLLNIYNALLSAGKITSAQYDEQAVTYNAATIDVFTEGIELELVANPTKNLTLRFGYSYSERRRDNFFKEVFTYYDAKTPEWHQLSADDPALRATIDNEVRLIHDELDAQIARQAAPFSSRPDKFNFTTRYKFSEGRLKGAFVGGALRYQGKNYMQNNPANGQVWWGNETLFADAFAGYRMRLPWMKSTLSLQLNVRNLSNSYQVGVGRLNDTYDGIRRIYLNEPRSYRFTTTLEF